MSVEKKVLMYLQEDKLAFKGGPFAVGWCYNEEKKKRGDSFLTFLSPSTNRNNAIKSKNKSKLIRIFQNIELVVKNYIHYKYKAFKPKNTGVDFSTYDIIHFHNTRDLYEERNHLKDFKGIVLLQSHSPQPLSDELYNSVPGLVKALIPSLKKKLRGMDEYAFRRADYILFPCSYAEEPYYNNWPEYKEIHDSKVGSYRYILTGIPQVHAKRQRLEVRNELRIKDSDFVISYVGRHNIVKGYDLLKQIAHAFLSKHSDAYVVTAGKEYPIKRLDHERWIEIGWTNDAHSYISSSDVFILPNRETYFDIVMLEVLSLGKIVVASRTGGNKFFEDMKCPGIFLYDSIDECISLLDLIKKMSLEEREYLQNSNKSFFQDNLTVEAMYDSYMEMIAKL